MSLPLPPSNEFHDLSIQEESFFTDIKKLPVDSQEKIRTAYSLAQKAHTNQNRDDGTPYILHPLRSTISLLSECAITDPDIICASLLHDVVEDTEVTLVTIEHTFGSTVSRLVSNVTRARPAVEDEEHIRRDKANKFTTLMEADEKTRLIKCADVLDNVRSWPNLPCDSKARKKMPRWFDETRDYALPLAKKTNPILFQELQNAFSYAQSQNPICDHSHSS